jgi:D-lactate dehydrogenase
LSVQSNSKAAVSDLRQCLDPRAVLTDPGDCWTYGYDNSKQHAVPAAIALPATHDEAAAVVGACYEHNVPLTVRGRGTGTTGAAVPVRGGVVMSTERMSRILSVDIANRVAVVQAGVTNGALQREVESRGFFWPPDPTSAEYCSIGGNLGCNSAGPRAVKYGTPRENTLGLRAVAGNGEAIRTGCYTTKGVVGYDLTRLLIGSEGTLAVITEATLLLTPMPPAVATMRAIYADMTGAAAAVSSIMGQPATPRVLEFMDRASIQLAGEAAGLDIPDGAGAMLIIEYDGQPATLGDGVASIRRAADNADLIEFLQADDRARVEQLWAGRKALSPALRNIAPKKINEDVVVPVSRMAELISHLEALAGRHDVRIVSFGHAGNGNIHVNLLGDPDDPDENRRMETCLAAVFDKVLELGGTLSGEHGIGMEKSAYVGLEIEPQTRRLMQAIKTQFDPRGILNPGKIFPTGDVPT